MKLVHIFVFLSLISLIFYLYSNHIFYIEIKKLSKIFLYYNFCEKNEKYLLEEQNPDKYCDKIIKKSENFDCDLFYDDNSERTSCFYLSFVLAKKKENCFKFFNRDSIEKEEYNINENCQVLLNSIK